MIQNISTALAEKNIKLGFKPGSFLAGFKNRWDVHDLIINELADKFAAEMKFYKNDLFPVLKEFNSEIDSKAPFIKSNVKEDIVTEEIKMPYLFKDLKNKGLLNNKEPYTHGISFSTQLLFEGFDPATTSDIRELFKDANGSLDHLADILPAYSDEELKDFLNNYGRLIFDTYKPVETNPVSNYRDYRVLGVRSNNILKFKDEIALFHSYICNRIINPVPSNVNQAAYEDTLKAVKADLEHMMANITHHYDVLVGNKTVIVVTVDEPKKVYTVSENLEDFLGKATKDAWSAIRGCAPVIGLLDVSYLNVDALLNMEDRAIASYNSYTTNQSIKDQESDIKRFRDLYVNTAVSLWTSYISDDLKVYSKYGTQEELTGAVEEYIKTVATNEVVSLNPAIAVNIVGGIFFGKTSFLPFVEDTMTDKVFPNFDQLTEKDSVTVAGMLLLTKHLVNELAETNADGHLPVL